jgi:hypothetical protein
MKYDMSGLHKRTPRRRMSRLLVRAAVTVIPVSTAIW